MRSILHRLSLVLALGLFIVTLIDVASGFTWLPPAAAVTVGLSSLLTALLVSRAFPLPRTLIPLILLLSSSLAVACRLGGYEPLVHRTDEEWDVYRHQVGLRIADQVIERFTALVQSAHSTVETLAQAPSLSRAVAEVGSRDSLLQAFRILENTVLPHVFHETASGITLYDTWQTPLAWAGKNADLTPFFETRTNRPTGHAFILEQGVFTYLVVTQSLGKDGGALSVEIPLAARRSVDNRYQADYEVVSSWADKSISTDFVDVREEAPELVGLFARSNDRYWGGTHESPVLYFPLRSISDDVLGVCALAAEDPSTTLLERRRSTQRLAGGCLALAAFVIVLLLAVHLWRVVMKDRRTRELLAWVLLLSGTAWGFRLTLLVTDVPLAFGTDADNPAYYASDLFFDFLRSPVDFLFTAIVILCCTLAVCLPFLSPVEPRSERKSSILGALFMRSSMSLTVLALLVVINSVVRNAWTNSNLPLGSPGLVPSNPPLLAVQLGLLSLFFAAGVVSVFLFGRMESRTAGSDSSKRPDPLQLIVVDLVVFAAVYALLKLFFPGYSILPALVPLVVFHLIALKRRGIRERLHSQRLYPRLITAFLMTLGPVLSFYPAMILFEGRTVRQFVESTVAPAVLHHGDSNQYVLLETLETIDRMELAGRLGLPDQADLAYQIWSGTDLSVAALSSSVEVLDERGALISRFALNFPILDWTTQESGSPPTEDWDIEQVPYPGEPNRPRVLNARRAFRSTDGMHREIRVRLLADWSNLPFISARNPYIDLFRAAGTETPLPSPHEDLYLFVFDLNGNPIFRSSETVLTVDQDMISLAGTGYAWIDHILDGQKHNVLLFSDGEYLFALSYLRKTTLGYAAEVIGWALLAAAIGTVYVVGLSLIGMAAGEFIVRPHEIWSGVGTSFYGKLFVAFVLLALVPTISLAVLARGIVVQQLERDVEQEGLARARVVERFVWDYLLYQRMDASERGVAAVDDSFLEWVGGLVDTDVDLYSRGELVATSKRELFGSGLLPTRAAPTVYREVVLNRANNSIHHESVGSFQYLVVSMPITLERWGEPGILSLPLASRQREINRQVASLNQTVLVAAICFSLVAATLAYSLARRIAEPINTLTDATRRVAQGDFDVNLDAPSHDEIGALSESFGQMITDLKQQREHLERTKKLEAWAEMARQVAHEVKNPLTPIQLSTEHLRRVVDDERVDFKKVLAECTDTILQQVRTLRQISMEFSTFANPAPIEPEITDIGRLVTETVEPYLQAPPFGVSVELAVDPGLPRVAVDKRLIQRTLINLLENAFHALNGRGRVKVITHPLRDDDGRWVEVAVSDTGAGIEPELHERIFEPYFSTRAGGTGLGLAIARKAVEDHGGNITLESEPGRGTTVRVRLPVDVSPAAGP